MDKKENIEGSKVNRHIFSKVIVYLSVALLAIVTFLVGLVLVLMLVFAACGNDNIGDISYVAISPTKQYQAEVVQISYGATGGESVICVETAGENAFPLEHEKNTDNSIRIKETKMGWGGQYEIEWISDNSFTVLLGTDFKHYYLIEMNGNSYTVLEGLVINESKTRVLDRNVSGDVIEVTAEICVKNNIDDVVSFSADTYAATDGTPYREAKLTADDNFETGEPLRIGPNEEKTFIIKFVGEKNPDEEFLDDEIDRVYLGIRQIG